MSAVTALGREERFTLSVSAAHRQPKSWSWTNGSVSLMPSKSTLPDAVPSPATAPDLGSRRDSPPLWRRIRFGELAPPMNRQRLLLWLVGVAVLTLSQPAVWTSDTQLLWYPPAGLGLVLVAWLGVWGVLATFLSFLVVQLVMPPQAFVQVPPLVELVLLAVEATGGWLIYHGVGKGSLRINDPRSATAYLLIVPGAFVACAALARAAFAEPGGYWHSVSEHWIRHAISYLAISPALLVLATPWLARKGLIPTRDSGESDWIDACEQVGLGDALEMTGLALCAAFLGGLLPVRSQPGHGFSWQLWTMLLLVIVWASLRQGLRGGSLAAVSAALFALIATGAETGNSAGFLALQGHLLALCSTALLVGASSGWIRASETRYRQIVGHMPVVLYSARFDSAPVRGRLRLARVVLVSAACEEVFGCSAKELVGDHAIWLKRVHPDDRELIAAAISQLGRQQGPIRCEYRLEPSFLPASSPASATTRSNRTPLPHPANLSVTPSGTRDRWVRDTLVPNHDTSGKLQGWEGVVEDITTQRSLAHDLQRTSTMLHTLVANLPAGVFFVQGIMGMPTLVNTRARQLLGQREDPSAGITHLPRIYRLHRPDGTLYPWEELPVYKALHLGITSMRDDIVVHRPDGRQVPLITWAAPIDLGPGAKQEAAVWVFEDLTSLQQAEAARLDSEARLCTIVEVMAEGLIVEDQDGKIVECNPGASAILGRRQEELLGSSFLSPELDCMRDDGSPFPRQEHPDIVCQHSQQPVRGVVMGIPVTTPTGEKSLRWILVNCMPLTSVQSGRMGVRRRTVITFADISASRQIHTELERVQRLEVAARLASGFVHDFNNLLTAILCLTQMAQLKLEPDHPLLPDLETIQAAAEEAGRLAAQLLAFSKQRRTALQPVDLNQMVDRTLLMLQSSLPPTIEVEVELSAEPSMVLADDGQVQQVIMNLCLNARDAMPSGGKLTVRTEVTTGRGPFPRAESKNGKEACTAGPGWARLSIQDTGHGIDKSILGKVFDPFFSTKERGTGLGLAVVRQVVDNLRGRVEVWTEPNQGTRFDIWLPLCEPESR